MVFLHFFFSLSFFFSFLFCVPFYNKMETNRLIESESNVEDISKRKGYLSLFLFVTNYEFREL